MNAPTYAFLSKPPPPPQKKRPTCPPPPTPTFARKRSSTFTSIATWAAHVQPGSPGSPHSIRRRSSLSRRPSVSSRRTVTPSPRTASFLLIETPSPNTKDFSIDLTDLGYTSVFVHLPNTPLKFMPSKPTVNPDTFPPPPPTRTRPAPLNPFRSLSILRSRPNATLPPSPKAPTESSPQILAASIVKRKKAVYAHLKPAPAPKSKSKPAKPKTDLPPSLAAELALMQFADGGSTEENIKRLMEAHARAAVPAGTKPSVTAPPVGDVYRDAKGGIWWDREEEMEYVHLLGGRRDGSAPEKWVSFGGEVKEGGHEDEEGELAIANLAGDGGLGRRDSANSIASATSSLDPCNIIKPAEEDAAYVRVPLAPLPITTVPEQPKPARRTPSPPLLTIPSRPRNGQHHLRPSPNFFLLDLNAFNVPPTPRTPRTPKTPRTPVSPYPTHSHTHTHVRTRSSPTRPVFPHSHTPVHTQRRHPPTRRRRPAPLNIVAHAPMRGVSPELDGVDVVMASDAKRDFLDDSFAPPAPVIEKTTVHVQVEPERMPGLKKKASRPILGLFGGRR